MDERSQIRPRWRIWPRSLFWQVMASVALALLVAQAVSTVLLFRAAEERRQTETLTGLAFQLVTGAERENFRQQRRALRMDRAMDSGAMATMRRRSRSPGGLPRRLRYQSSDAAPILPGETNDEAREQRLSALLAAQGVEVAELQVISRQAGDDPALQRAARRLTRFAANPDWRERRILVAGLRREGEDSWEIARTVQPRRDGGSLTGLVAQTLIIFGFLMAILFVLLRRITQPLAALTRRVESFGRTQGSAAPLAVSGPNDIRDLITAQNAMEARIAALLDEKDVMLGAIGHDLKTPLAALRVRIESVESDAERAKMAAGIEDITATLDDILSLARIGRPSAPPEHAQLGALTASVAEEFEDMGEPVTLGETARIAASVHVTWIRRALRNLIANALRYGGSADVSLHRETATDGEFAVFRVTDNGPGIADDRIADMLEPFTRGEASRNRATGGAGLGLTIARAIAQQHGGELLLANRPEGGLRAELRLPLTSA